MTTYIEKTEKDYEKFMNDLMYELKYHRLYKYLNVEKIEESLNKKIRRFIERLNNHDIDDGLEFYDTICKFFDSYIRHIDYVNDLITDFYLPYNGNVKFRVMKDIAGETTNIVIIYAPKMTAVKNANV